MDHPFSTDTSLTSEHFRAKMSDEDKSFADEIEQLLSDHRSQSKTVLQEAHLSELYDRFNTTEMSDESGTLSNYASILKHDILPHVVNVGSEYCVGHMTSALPRFQAEISRLVSLLNQNVVKIETSRVLTLIERQSIGMLHRLAFSQSDDFYAQHLFEPSSVLGVVTSGGTLSNITALWMARKRLGPGELDGNEVIVASELAHYSFRKAASLLGLKRDPIKVPAHSNGAINLVALEETLTELREAGDRVLAVVGIAGTTETGAVDDLKAMAAIAKRHNTHFHVDGAWGGALLLSNTHRHLLDGLELADTFSICGHKQLYLPQGISILLCRDPSLGAGIRTQAKYQARPKSLDLGMHSAEGSRPAMSLHLHAAFHVLGRRGYEELIDTSIEKARIFAELINAHPAFELLAKPKTNLIVYRYLPEQYRTNTPAGLSEHIDRVNTWLQERQFLEGNSLISRTTLSSSEPYGRGSVVALRAVLANPRTTVKTLQSVLEEQVMLGDMAP